MSLQRQHVVPPVVDLDVHLRVADDVEVVFGEVGRHDARHERLDLGDGLVLDRRIDRHRAGRHAGAAADDDDAFGVLGHERREVAEHPLQAHVLRLARRLDLAGVVIVEDAVRHPRDRDRRRHALADVNDLVLAECASPCSGRRR